MPLDGPLMRIWVQPYDPVDQDHVPADQRPKGLLVWKCHHSFADGVSVVSMILAMSKEYDQSYWVKALTVQPPWWFSTYLRLSFLFCVPRVALATVFARTDDNYLIRRKGKNGLCGAVNLSSLPPISMESIKVLSQAEKVTINDIVMTALTTALGVFFKENNDKAKDI